jgi:hypothetical protein
MSNIDLKFPVYRKTLNSRNFYCVSSQHEFIEIQAVGTRWVMHESVAEIYPMRLFIMDLIACTDGAYEECSEYEFREIKAKVVSSSEKP